MTTIPKPPLNKVALYQLAILLPVYGALSLLDSRLANSVLVGALIQIVPQAWFAKQAFKHSGASQASLVVSAIYRGQTGKLILTAALLITAFTLFKHWNYFALFAAFVAMIPLQFVFTKRALQKKV